MSNPMDKALSAAAKFNKATGFRVTNIEYCSEQVALLRITIDPPWQQDQSKVRTFTLKFVDNEIQLTATELDLKTITHIVEVMQNG